jgi:long-subunit acyl-CoA synthetase (AMP-forming)
MTITTKPSNWSCDQCYRILMHGEFRFNCTICINYDLCDKCVTTIDPPHPHRVMRELAHAIEEISTNYRKVNMATGIQMVADVYRDRFCMGVRDVDKTNPSLYADTYSWITYETVGTRSKNFGCGLRDMIESRGFLGICAGQRPEWIITDFACILQSIISVPIYCLFNDRELVYVINNTKVSVIVCDRQMLAKFIRLYAECPSLRHIICMDPIPETMLSKYRIISSLN